MSASAPPASRNLQLDGWRAISVLGVLWLHWAPADWLGEFPFAIGLFFLLCLTGFLITRILLRERAMDQALGPRWRREAFFRFQRRRALRILTPCLGAMLFAWIMNARDLREHPLVYLAQLSNFHLAQMRASPAGSAHFWTLAIQQQIYLIWPVLILWTPRKALLPALLLTAAVGPATRAITFQFFPQIIYPGLLTPCTLDYFAIGGLLAYAMERGLKPGDRRVAWAGWIALPLYILLYTGHMPIPGVHHFQQTLLSIASTALISATLAGFHGWLGKLLTHPAIQHLGRISYSLYLFHGPMPLLVGFALPFLWKVDGPLMMALRITAYALSSWGAAWLSWRYLEQPLDRLKRRLPTPAAIPKSPAGFS